jgi:Transposase DDE domain
VRHSPGSHRITLGADKAYDVHEFVDDLRNLNITPHIAQNTTNRSSAIDTRTTRHPGYAISQQKRKRTEEPFGWGKTTGGLARPMLRGVARLGFKFILTMAAYDLIRLPKLRAASAWPAERSIYLGQSRRLSSAQTVVVARRRHEFQWPARDDPL